MTSRTPEISVVMPVRNGAATLDTVLRSITAQTVDSWELVVVDDCSDDGTLALLRARAAADDRIRVVAADRPGGVAVRLNDALDAARGEFIARMDADDVCYPERFAVQLAAMRADERLDLVGAGAVVFRGDGRIRGVRTHAGSHDDLTSAVLDSVPLMHPSWFGHRKWFVRHRYDPRARSCEDQELLLRAHASSRYAALPDILLGYREDRLKVRQSLRARRHHAAVVVHYARDAGLAAAGARAAARQVIKAGRDVVLAAARMDEVVLHKRNRPASAAEAAEWRAVWSAANGFREPVA